MIPAGIRWLASAGQMPTWRAERYRQGAGVIAARNTTIGW